MLLRAVYDTVISIHSLLSITTPRLADWSHHGHRLDGGQVRMLVDLAARKTAALDSRPDVLRTDIERELTQTPFHSHGLHQGRDTIRAGVVVVAAAAAALKVGRRAPELVGLPPCGTSRKASHTSLSSLLCHHSPLVVKPPPLLFPRSFQLFKPCKTSYPHHTTPPTGFPVQNVTESPQQPPSPLVEVPSSPGMLPHRSEGPADLRNHFFC